ncbi:hypothetical protein [Streptomyces drozdowiczii]
MHDAPPAEAAHPPVPVAAPDSAPAEPFGSTGHGDGHRAAGAASRLDPVRRDVVGEPGVEP